MRPPPGEVTLGIKGGGARASRYRVYGVIGLHIGKYPKYPRSRDTQGGSNLGFRVDFGVIVHQDM